MEMETKSTVRDGIAGRPGRVHAGRGGNRGAGVASPRARAARLVACQVEADVQRLFAMAEQLDSVLREEQLRRRQAWAVGGDTSE
ncbi:MAG: hypothetical protein ABSD48_17615 [Armatimonadota bacterium]|jgi:hypothetical protein